MDQNRYKFAFVMIVATFFSQMAAYPSEQAAVKFYINGQDVEAAYLMPSETCTVEIVSNHTNAYEAYIDYSAFGGDFYHVSTEPEAGNLAMVTDFDWYYEMVAAGIPDPPLPGVHFVFEYTAPPSTWVDNLILVDEYLTVLDENPPN